MTPNQLERKAKQLYSIRRLIENLEELEETIKTFMTIQGKSEINTASFTLRLVEEGLVISTRSYIYLHQLRLNFTNPYKKEDLRDESHYRKKIFT
jgi:hypothetical protein